VESPAPSWAMNPVLLFGYGSAEIYVISRLQLCAVSRESGSVLWCIGTEMPSLDTNDERPRPAVVQSIVTGGGSLLVGTRGSFGLIDRWTGAWIWSRESPLHFVQLISEYNGVAAVYASSSSFGIVRGLDVRTGAVSWSHDGHFVCSAQDGSWIAVRDDVVCDSDCPWRAIDTLTGEVRPQSSTHSVSCGMSIALTRDSRGVSRAIRVAISRARDCEVFEENGRLRCLTLLGSEIHVVWERDVRNTLDNYVIGSSIVAIGDGNGVDISDLGSGAAVCRLLVPGGSRVVSVDRHGILLWRERDKVLASVSFGQSCLSSLSEVVR
jgi:hypothetical protein